MAMTKIFEQLQSGGTACFLIVNPGVSPGQNIDIGIGESADLSDAVGDTQSISITKLHWSGTVSITDGTVTIPLREYDKLREETHFIKDKSLISIIDKIEELVRAMIKMRIQDKGLNAVVDKTEELVRALRKHIV